MHILLTITSGSSKACKGFQCGYRMCGTTQLGHWPKHARCTCWVPSASTAREPVWGSWWGQGSEGPHCQTLFYVRTAFIVSLFLIFLKLSVIFQLLWFYYVLIIYYFYFDYSNVRLQTNSSLPIISTRSAKVWLNVALFFLPSSSMPEARVKYLPMALSVWIFTSASSFCENLITHYNMLKLHYIK